MPKLSDLKFEVSAQLARYAGPQAPKEQKVLASRGMLPIPPRDLIQVLYALTREEDPVIRDTAGKSLLKLPENILKTVAEDPKTHPLILNFLARRLSPDAALQEAVCLNRSAHDETVVFQASLPNKRVVDIISQNQLRILRCPPIVDALAENVLTGQAMLERIIKFVEMETKRSAKAAPPGEGMEVEVEELKEDEPEEVATVTEGGDDEVGAVTVDDSPWAAMTFDQDLLKDHSEEEATEEEIAELETNLVKKIGGMKISEKIKLALMGGTSARSILIKDANKMVSTAVLKSPRITDNEIENISRSRSVADDVIRMVANNKEWTRGYQVKLNLVNNPKTPLPDAMRFMNFLRDKDLRELSRSRNVPNQVATQAKRMLQRKEMKGKPGQKH